MEQLSHTQSIVCDELGSSALQPYLVPGQDTQPGLHLHVAVRCMHANQQASSPPARPQVTGEVKEAKRRLDKRSSEYDAARLKHLGHRCGGQRGGAGAANLGQAALACCHCFCGASKQAPLARCRSRACTASHAISCNLSCVRLDPPCRRSASHVSTWAGKGSDPDKSFADLLAAKAAADEARFEVARRFTQVGRGLLGEACWGRPRCAGVARGSAVVGVKSREPSQQRVWPRA